MRQNAYAMRESGVILNDYILATVSAELPTTSEELATMSEGLVMFIQELVTRIQRMVMRIQYFVTSCALIKSLRNYTIKSYSSLVAKKI